MPKKDTEKKDRDIIVAAYWRVAKPGLPSERLARLLGVSRSTFERRVEVAKEKGLVAEDWIFKDMPSLLPEVLSRQVDADLREKILHKFGSLNISKLTVVPSWPPHRTSSRPPEAEIAVTNMQMVARAAAGIFRKRLKDMKVVGLSYGRSLKAMIDILEHFGPTLSSASQEDTSKSKRTIVTVVGSLSFHFDDPRHGDWLDNSASHLTNRLARILGANMCERRFLETPVYVPRTFLDQFSKKKTKSKRGEITGILDEDDALQVVKMFVEAIPTYRDVFAKGSAIEKLDTVITSVGDLDTGFGAVPEAKLAPFLTEAEFNALRDEAVGDIAGFYLNKFGTTGAKDSIITKANDRIFGLKIQDLEKIAQRAEKNGTPGVIVIASSRSKARVIEALIRYTNVISELVISGDLAEELLDKESDQVKG